jgi:hypothetical protein
VGEFWTSAEDGFLENQEESSKRTSKTPQVNITRAFVALKHGKTPRKEYPLRTHSTEKYSEK